MTTPQNNNKNYRSEHLSQKSTNPRQDSQKSEAEALRGQEAQKTTPENDSWKNDPSLKNMDLKKLAFLSELVSQSGNQSLDSLLPFLISANKNANSMGLQFSNSETDLILNVLKSRMTPEEQSKIETLRQMANIFGRRNP